MFIALGMYAFAAIAFARLRETSEMRVLAALRAAPPAKGAPPLVDVTPPRVEGAHGGLGGTSRTPCGCTEIGLSFWHETWTVEGGGPAGSMDDLQKCQAELRALKDENRQLREAASAFGHLAERLNGQLQAERRTRETDRRAAARSPAGRRDADENTNAT